MNIEELREFCMSIPLATEDMPFKDEYLMFRVYDKWFTVIPLDDTDLNISVKCDPDYAIELREKYNAVSPAWHFNKKYWNSIQLNGDVSDELVKKLILHSVDEVLAKLPKKQQAEYQALKNGQINT
ncbi:MmcQ/YjbR family DNA-binding protein [Chryseobacterium sp. Mn2064]|uniref:MmcQ/YjbR family DNA-binding protein n=1 Tax=Chryseobacterium sp. Mn2064 TaxID=3395263 RepID=UPI003BDDEAC4